MLKGFFGARQRRAGLLRQRAAARRGAAASRCARPTTTTAHDYVNLITLRGGGHAIAGTLVGLKGEPRIVMVDDHTVDVPPAKHMLVVRNDDRPGMIGHVGSVLGEAGMNIADMAVGRSPEGVGRADGRVDLGAGPTRCSPLQAADGITAVGILSRG